jgi:5-methylcytosine-specific restriction endonuclease McrBC GTP-binding regulatory subunit McrB
MDTNHRNNKVFNVEYFRNRFIKHDKVFKKILTETERKLSSVRKRNYLEAFGQNPPYTRFSDEIN